MLRGRGPKCFLVVTPLPLREIRMKYYEKKGRRISFMSGSLKPRFHRVFVSVPFLTLSNLED